MPYIVPTFRSLPRASALLLAAGGFGCSGGDLVLPKNAADIQLTVVSGNQQTGTVGEPLPKPVTVELRDQDGNPIVGREVAFAVTGGPAEASVTPPTAVTDGDGQALGQWELGTKPGEYTAEARVLPAADDPSDVDMPVVQVTASAQPDTPDTVRAESETNQVGDAGEAVEDPPVVRVVDRFGNPVPGVTVTWNVVSGGGTAAPAAVTTDADGRATTTWTLGQRFVLQQLNATVSGTPTGSPVAFTAVPF